MDPTATATTASASARCLNLKCICRDADDLKWRRQKTQIRPSAPGQWKRRWVDKQEAYEGGENFDKCTQTKGTHMHYWEEMSRTDLSEGLATDSAVEPRLWAVNVAMPLEIASIWKRTSALIAREGSFASVPSNMGNQATSHSELLAADSTSIHKVISAEIRSNLECQTVRTLNYTSWIHCHSIN